jgi:hypothetical protein
MMAEGMIDESLVLTKTIHDRYHAFKRNPFNEIECSDHYARAMTSYGVFINACGFTYHGPKGYIGFAPKINPEKFVAPFTAASGWGSFSQQRNEKSYAAKLKVKQGELLVKKISIELDKNHHATTLKMLYQNKPVACKFSQMDAQCEISIADSILIHEDEVLSVEIS